MMGLYIHSPTKWVRLTSYVHRSPILDIKNIVSIKGVDANCLGISTCGSYGRGVCFYHYAHFNFLVCLMCIINLQALAQPNKRLRLLSEHVPHGYRRKSLFDVLTRCNVPLLRATWFVKVTYLNQVCNSSELVSCFLPNAILHNCNKVYSIIATGPTNIQQYFNRCFW
jgi:hypothetical protein